MTKVTNISSAFRRKAEISLHFPEAQDWRTTEAVLKSPVFLASQKIAGVVEIRHRKNLSVNEDKYLRITLTGIWNRSTADVPRSYV